MQRHDEETRIVVLTAEDFKNTFDFFDHFKIEMPPKLKQVLVRLQKDPKQMTFEDQKLFRALLAQAMLTVEHPLLKDKSFENIREKCDKAWYDAQFDMDVEDIFAKDAIPAASKAE